jgi:hypothetical protein
MLIETIKEGEVITVKLTSGEELVGKLEGEDSDTIRLSVPLTLVMSQQGIGMQQYLFTADPDKTLTINKRAVSCFTLTKEDFAKVYKERTSAILTPPAKQFIV